PEYLRWRQPIMDQLKQVLKYQFWILLGVALILPFVGWGMSRSQIMAQAVARADELRKFSDQLVVKPHDPNKTWAAAVEALNVDQEKQHDAAWRALYERQLPFRVWPEGLPDDTSKFAAEDRQTFQRTSYPAELDVLRKIVKPYDEVDGTGMCVVNDDLLPPPE